MAHRTTAVKRDEARELAQDPSRLRWRRRAAGLSVNELARQARLSSGTVSALENGRASAEPATLTKLAATLGCAITDLMPDEPNGSAA